MNRFILTLIVFLDYLGQGLGFAVFPPLFLTANRFSSSLMLPHFKLVIMLGALISTYSLAQFVGAPLFGALSDSFGRKKTLIICLFGTLLGFILSGIAIATNSLTLLFCSRCLSGFVAGNVAIAMSATADASSKKQRASNFSYVQVGVGLGLSIGPIIGGKFSDPSLISWFTFSVPFYFVAMLNLVILVLFHFLYKEKSHRRTGEVVIPHKIKNSFLIISKAKYPLAIWLVFILGWAFYQQFFPVYMIRHFNFNQSDLGDLYLFVGLMLTLNQMLIIRRVNLIFSHKVLSLISLISISLILLIIGKINLLAIVYILLGFYTLFIGLAMTNLAALVSECSEQHQGAAMGIMSAIKALSTSLVAGFGSIIVAYDVHAPLKQSATVILLSSVVLIAYMLRLRKK